MSIRTKREIVVEFERVLIVRKRAKTHLLICSECGRKMDFVFLDEASQLFETAADDLFRFVKENSCHFQMLPAGGVAICLYVFLHMMRKKSNGFRLQSAQGKQLESRT